MLFLLFTIAAAAPLELSAGYFGHLVTHPGVVLGVERPLKVSGPHGFWCRARAAVYTHPGNHVGVWIRPEVGYRLVATAGPYIEVDLGPGYLHRFVSGALYRSTAEGVRRGPDPGRPSFSPGAGVGVGWDLSPGFPFRVGAHLDAWSATPINRGWRAAAAGSVVVTWLGSK